MAPLAAVILAGLVVEPVHISSGSMSPTYAEDDHLLVTRFSPRSVDRGDVVVVRSPDGGSNLKRVVAIGGDDVAIVDALLTVNGRTVPEPYVDHDRIDGTYFGPVSVPQGRVFLLGDDRAGSVDSRDYGPVSADAVEGTALVRIWPVRRP